MTIKTLASQIAKLEGKKTQARIGEVREILGLLSDIAYAEEQPVLGIFKTLWDNGKNRSKKKK